MSRRGAQPWYRCTTACPLPRAIIHLLSGVVTTKASASEAVRAAQNRASDSWASMALGQRAITPLSISSMTAMESVSAASAPRKAVRKPTPAFRTPRSVSA